MSPLPNPDACYRAVQSRDARFDGWFVTAVTSTHIYCRPSCPAVTPKQVNVRFYPTAAAAQQAGFRACLRCRPDAAPGSPEWNARADLVGRAMRLIADGTVEREGVPGLSRRLGYSERQVHRQLTAELGAGPLALARAQRSQTARTLIETTSLPFADVAFAAGFASVRQFNDTVRAVFSVTPTALRAARRRGAATGGGAVTLRLPYRAPFDATGLWAFLGARAVPGIEEFELGAVPTYRRALNLAHGGGRVTLHPGDGHVACTLHLDDLRDLGTAVERCRRLLDLDADPIAVDSALGADPALAASIAAAPGRRLPGAVSGTELAVRAVVGQQISVAAARTVLTRLVATHGSPLPNQDDALTTVFPSAEVLAEVDPATLPMPAARARTLSTLCRLIADGELQLEPGAEPAAAEATLLAVPGIGPWTASYLTMRSFGLPDTMLASDLAVQRGAAALGLPATPGALAQHAERWRPWRSYAVMHLWSAAAPTASSSRSS